MHAWRYFKYFARVKCLSLQTTRTRLHACMGRTQWHSLQLCCPSSAPGLLCPCTLTSTMHVPQEPPPPQFITLPHCAAANKEHTVRMGTTWQLAPHR